jgi:hypothetical protein
MKVKRGASQILFGFLPEQTVDLENRVWKVREWVEPSHRQVDDIALRRALIRAIFPWTQAGKDSDLANDLLANRDIEVVTLNLGAGVYVDSFPRLWRCKQCHRTANTSEAICRCGRRQWAQLHFVGYHECGKIQEPFLRRCPQHNEVRLEFPGTASAADIRLECPICGTLIQKGLGMPPCQCGQGRITYNVHRAASVYSPKTIVIINVASPRQSEALKAVGGGTRALGWMLDGMTSHRATDVGLTRSIFMQQLAGQGLPAELASQMADLAEKAGQFVGQQNDDLDQLSAAVRNEGEREAVEIALAVDSSRIGTRDLIASAGEGSKRRNLYRSDYARSLQLAGLEEVELVDRFPVMTGSFGYTRGDSGPGKAKLIPFRSRAGNYTVYADIAQTEAMFVRLQPSLVASWLRSRGHQIPHTQTERAARLAILTEGQIPPAGSETDPPTVGSELLTLIHSYAHRFIRRTAMFAGIDRNGLAEFLVPLHLGFFIYATNRGDFVMGGLQAVFEDELHELVRDVVTAEHRCALDPGCSHAGAACAACLHLGEPSCRFYNGYLDRRTIVGPKGYLTAARQTSENQSPRTSVLA